MIPKLLVKKKKVRLRVWSLLLGILYPCHPFIIDKHFHYPYFYSFFTKPTVLELSELQLSKTASSFYML